MLSPIDVGSEIGLAARARSYLGTHEQRDACTLLLVGWNLGGDDTC